MSRKKSVRFTSKRSAENFAESVGGELRDLRQYESRKSDFKVVYGNGSGSRNESDFNSEMNMGGIDWHTSEDL